MGLVVVQISSYYVFYFIKIHSEPKPSRSSGSSNDSASNSSSNYGDDRYGMSHDLMMSNNGDCALHVICSPMV